MEIPKPGESHRKLEKLAGRWTGDEKLKAAGPWKPSGENATGTFDFREAADGFFLLADYDEEIEGGKPGIRGHGVLGWDPKAKAYTLHWFDNAGTPPAKPGIGQWQGDALTFEHDMGDHKGRTIFELDGEDALNFRVEMSEDGKKWDRAVDGRYKREDH
jgi:uncharacterized protein DUF1579